MSNGPNKRRAAVLLVEDDAAHRNLVQRAFEDARLLIDIHFAENGEEALNFLRDIHSPKPNFILMDVNMPRMNGIECLREIRKDPKLRLFPVVILTTSSDERDVMEAYGFGVNAYVCKPVGFKEFMTVIPKIGEFWLELVTNPS